MITWWETNVAASDAASLAIAASCSTNKHTHTHIFHTIHCTTNSKFKQTISTFTINFTIVSYKKTD